ncbi:ABC transporter substrate-binding protein [Stenotrophomonas mori]|uniref:ABC transporter substrate-binding protein n=1 Tax=Stenotrophomonas mori TaxID=2871096 RepID=A0ABT0SEY8_9GAMM|nr:ABC transporter substrate-binding protein [Stenotrophomonas mori]MCL7713882.1 ABC transporter substrate-binding protein [Stenotrophomonas mori]
MNTPPFRLLATLSLTAALVACQKPEAGSRDAGAALSVGDTVSGEITSSSPLNYNDGSRHQAYRLSLKNGEAVALELNGSLNGQLSIFDGQKLLASATSSGYEGERGASALNLAFKAPKDGTFLVAVNSAGSDAFGPYQLKSSTIVPYDGKPLAAGSEAVDWLMGGKQEYALKVETAGLYTIDMESSVLDAYLHLTGRNVDIEDDDGGDRLNARIRAYLEAGDYTIAASSVNDGTGSFKLGVAMTQLDKDMVIRDGASLTVGQSVHGMVDSRGHRSFTLTLDRARHLQFDALADNIDSVLHITGPGVDAEDDDGGNGTNARLRLRMGPGRYNVMVSSFGNRQGVFELQTTDLGGDSAAQGDSNRKDDALDAAAAAAAADAAAAAAAAD